MDFCDMFFLCLNISGMIAIGLDGLDGKDKISHTPYTCANKHMALCLLPSLSLYLSFYLSLSLPPSLLLSLSLSFSTRLSLLVSPSQSLSLYLSLSLSLPRPLSS
jgi:hypothetical protein